MGVARGESDGVGGFGRFVYKALDGCWYWTGDVDRDGYGRYTSWADHRTRRIRIAAHRLIYLLEVGAIPSKPVSYEVDHLCRNKLCVRPDHLEAVPPAENRKRQGLAKRHCRNGHLLVSRDNRGWRFCGECHRIREKARSTRKAK